MRKSKQITPQELELLHKEIAMMEAKERNGNVAEKKE